MPSSRNWRTLFMGLSFIVAAALYYLLVVIAVTYLWNSTPQWWVDLGDTLGLSMLPTHLSWMQVNHSLSMFAAALPIALGIRLFKPHRPVVVAFAISIVALVIPNAWLGYAAFISSYSLPMQISASLDMLKFAFTLPVLTWLLFLRRRTVGPTPALAT